MQSQRLPKKRMRSADAASALRLATQLSICVMGLVTLVAALHYARFLLAPLSLAVIVGLMLGPIATRLENRHMPPALSAISVVLIFILLLSVLAAALAAPLASWADRVPQILEKLQLQLSSLQQPLETLKGLREQVRVVTGESDVRVSVEDSSPVEDVATLAPALLAQVLIFFAGLYFFVATRHQTRLSILKLCFDRRLRWRVAHIFRDVEQAISEYLLAITIINGALGVAVGLALWAIGVPSPALWGAMAALLNFVIYIGPAIMATFLFAIGLATFDTLAGAFIPPLVYLSINATEAQFVTPTVIGRHMTLNPFIVFLAIAFWLWLWGPLGGFIAIPALLSVHAIAGNILPGIKPPTSRRPAPG